MTIKTEPGITVEAAFEHLALRIASSEMIYKRYKGMGYVDEEGEPTEEPTPEYWDDILFTPPNKVYVTGLVTMRQIAASGGILQEGNRFFKFKVSDFTSTPPEEGEPTEPNTGDMIEWDGLTWILGLGGGGTLRVLWKKDPTNKLLTVFARRVA